MRVDMGSVSEFRESQFRVSKFRGHNSAMSKYRSVTFPQYHNSAGHNSTVSEYRGALYQFVYCSIADGTFKTAPLLFTQMYTIPVKCRGPSSFLLVLRLCKYDRLDERLVRL
jgi:hypothetical protein